MIMHSCWICSRPTVGADLADPRWCATCEVVHEPLTADLQSLAVTDPGNFAWVGIIPTPSPGSVT